MKFWQKNLTKEGMILPCDFKVTPNMAEKIPWQD